MTFWRMLSATTIALTLILIAPTQAETPAERDARMQWWRDAKFGMFIHWGVYAVPAGTYNDQRIGGIGEWIMRRGEIPVAEYREYARQFNPVKYAPEAWAKLAKDAGMRYVVITSKHHDGFALYDSAVTDWDIADATPYGKDLLAPLAEAVRDEGLKFGLYYSQAQDWTHPGGAKSGFNEGESWDEPNKGDFDQYLQEIALPQTKEILSKFQPDVLWWDTPTWMTRERAEPLHNVLADYPNIITNNRLGGGYKGDTETPEQHIPATGFKDRDWETCMTMNNTWGYKSYDHDWKSTETLLHNLVDIVSKGGNYLLNVGPTSEGEIPQESIDRLTEIGEWMAKNGESIYGTSPSPCNKPEWGRITSKSDRLYLHVFDWPADGKLLVPVTVETAGGRLLADGSREFDVESTEEGILVHLTGEPIDSIDTVVELDTAGTPTAVLQRVSSDEQGRLVLHADQAIIEGNAKLETIRNRSNIGHWTNAADSVVWHCKVPATGRYRITANVASQADSRLVVSASGDKVDVKATATGGYEQFETQEWGELQVDQPGEFSVEIKPSGRQWNAINLRALTLTPVK